ncbi:MAG: Crp/Fnr family transcriptional regulator [Bacteroidales bacterium]|nr:Crp/Fnr family transcriptional regulator [Bacteroidales bacterium]
MELKNINCVCENCDFRNIVLECLDDEEINDLCRNKKEFSYRKGEVIHHEGEKITSFKYLKNGLVKVFRRTSSGDEQIVTITRPFEFVSNMSVFSGNNYRYSVSALEDSVVCNISPDYIKSLLMNNGTFSIMLLTRIAEVNEKIIEQTLDLRQKNLIGRIAYSHLFFSSEIYNSRIFDLPVSRKEIADYIGMSTANVIRTLSEFRKEGIIRVYGRTVEISDLQKLEILSKRG